MNVNEKRWWDLPSAILLMVCLIASAARLYTTRWTASLEQPQLLVMLGLALGLLLGKSRFRGRVSFFFGAVFTLAFVPWALGVLMDGEIPWLERVQSLAGRLGTDLGQLFSNKPVQDPILFLASVCLFYWLASLWGGYMLVRRANPWGALAAVGLVSLVVEFSFDMYRVADSGSWYSLVFLLAAALLVARLYYQRSRDEWKVRGQIVEQEVGFDLARGAALVAVVLALAAWFSPSVVKSFTPGTRENAATAQQFQSFRQRINNAVSSLRSRAPLVVTSLGESMGLGQGTPLTDDVVFTVAPESGLLDVPRYYWTGRIYSTYLEDQWVTAQTTPRGLGPGSEQASYTWNGRKVTRLTFNIRFTLLRNLYYLDAPLDVSRTVSALYGASAADAPDITAMMIDPPLRAGESYTVRAAAAVPTEKQLRDAAEQPYPDWVTEQYLQLPPNFSPRISELAASVAGSQPTPYDKVTAVTAYLRNTIKYEAIIPKPPANQDALVWFLFDYKAGFCNYSATADVLMLRSLGVPARMVVGYAQGNWNAQLRRFEVSARDYHAWPEVFFPGIGWVPFEPTSSQPATFYPAGNDPNPEPSLAEQLRLEREAARNNPPAAPPPFEANPSQQANQTLMRNLSAVAVGLAAIALLVFAFLRYYKTLLKGRLLPIWLEQNLTQRGYTPPRWLSYWSRRLQLTRFERLFESVPQMLRLWGKKLPSGLTPAEQTAHLVEVVPELAGLANELLVEYQRAAYSPHRADYPRARKAVKQLRMLGYRLRLQRLLGMGGTPIYRS